MVQLFFSLNKRTIIYSSCVHCDITDEPRQGILKGEISLYSLTSCLTVLELVCFANKNKNCQLSYAHSKTVKQEVNSTVILPPLVFPGQDK